MGRIGKSRGVFPLRPDCLSEFSAIPAGVLVVRDIEPDHSTYAAGGNCVDWNRPNSSQRALHGLVRSAWSSFDCPWAFLSGARTEVAGRAHNAARSDGNGTTQHLCPWPERE